MNMIDIVVGAVIVTLIVLASCYLRRNKKKGAPCTGCSCCPLAEHCDSKNV